MQDLLLVRFGEIFLKGLNRPYFIRALVRKIRYAVRGMGAEVQSFRCTQRVSRS